jgi:hypothetical protein
MKNDEALRHQLIKMLKASEAHAGFDKAVKDLPAAKMGVRPEKMPHSAWELLEHIRLAQQDILEFSESKEYKERKWPDEYWPSSPEPPSPHAWEKSVKAVHAGRDAFIKLLEDPKRDLYEPLPWGDGQTLLREALLIIDHNAYHVGEIVTVRQLLGVWK